MVLNVREGEIESMTGDDFTSSFCNFFSINNQIMNEDNTFKFYLCRRRYANATTSQ